MGVGLVGEFWDGFHFFNDEVPISLFLSFGCLSFALWLNQFDRGSEVYVLHWVIDFSCFQVEFVGSPFK